MDISYFNPEGYADPTAYKAIRKIREDKDMKIYAGDIITAELANGKEKDFVIIAVHDKISQVLMLSDDDSCPYEIMTDEGMRYTNQDMIQYIFNDCATEVKQSLNAIELKRLLKAVADSIGCAIPEKKVECTNSDLIKLQAECDVYKRLYQDLLKEVMGR